MTPQQWNDESSEASLVFHLDIPIGPKAYFEALDTVSRQGSDETSHQRTDRRANGTSDLEPDVDSDRSATQDEDRTCDLDFFTDTLGVRDVPDYLCVSTHRYSPGIWARQKRPGPSH